MKNNTVKHYTVNVSGNCVETAENHLHHAYYANSVTAIEIKAENKTQARRIARMYGKVLFIFE